MEEVKSDVGRDDKAVGWTLPVDRRVIHDFESGKENEKRLSIYEITQEREQTLYEKSCCSEDVIGVWNQISLFILKRLKEGFGVTIPGFCTITYYSFKEEATDDGFMVQKIPILLLSDIFIQSYGLKRTQIPSYVKKAPITPLNLIEISTQAKVSLNIVQGSLIEVLQTFSRALICAKRIEFPFAHIGKLTVSGENVRMKFYEEFLSKLGFSSQDGVVLGGRATPLPQHIPTETYRSVFHLREVRSVHEDIYLNCQMMHKHKLNWWETNPAASQTALTAPLTSSKKKKETSRVVLKKDVKRCPFSKKDSEQLCGTLKNVVEERGEGDEKVVEVEKEEIGENENDGEDKIFRESYRNLNEEAGEGGHEEIYLNEGPGEIEEHYWDDFCIEKKKTEEITEVDLSSELRAHHYNLCKKILGFEKMKTHFRHKVTFNKKK